VTAAGAGRGGSGASSGVEAAAVPRFGSGAARQVVESAAARSACVIGSMWRSWEGEEASWCPAASGLY